MALLTTACVEPRWVEVPAPGAARSAVALFGPPSAPAARAFDLSGEDKRFSFPIVSEDPVYILYYEPRIEELGLEAGPLERAESRRFLPVPSRAFSLAPRDPSAHREVTEELTALPIYQAFTLPAPRTQEACAAVDGCFSLGTCEAPCARPMPKAPAAPEWPRLSCAGWARSRTVRELGVDTEASAERVLCDPRPEVTCEPNQITHPGAGCAPLGEDCAEWPSGLPSNTIYVRHGASGDGSAQRPYGSLSVALGRARDGAIVALAPSDEVWNGDVALSRDVVLRGCRGSRLSGRISVRAGRAELTHLTLLGGASVEVAPGATLIARGLTVEKDEPEVWLRVAGTATVTGSRVRGARAEVSERGALHVGQSQLIEQDKNALSVTSSGALSLTQVALTTREGDLCGGPNNVCEVVSGTGAARLRVSASRLTSRYASAATSVTYALVRVRDQVDLDVRQSWFELQPGTSDAAVLALGGARARLAEVEIFGPGLGVAARGSADAELSDVILVGANLYAFEHPVVTLSRVAFLDSAAGAMLFGGQSQVKLEDIRVDNALPGPALLPSEDFDGVVPDWCFQTFEIPLVVGERVHLERCRSGVSLVSFTTDPGQVHLTDLRIVNRRGEAGALYVVRPLIGDATGVTQRSSPMTIERLHIEGAQNLGFRAEQGAELTLSDVRIERVWVQERCEGYAPCDGAALFVGHQARGRLTTFWLSDSEVGLSLATEAFLAQDGILRGNQTGLEWVGDPREASDPLEFLTDVLFESNRADIRE